MRRGGGLRREQHVELFHDGLGVQSADVVVHGVGARVRLRQRRLVDEPVVGVRLQAAAAGGAR